jgi:hypothetical protein
MKHYRIVVFVLCTLTLAVGQDAGSSRDLQKFTDIEKGIWEAWKTHNVEAFKAAVSEDVVGVTNGEVTGKSNVVSKLANKSCELTDYSLEDFKLTMIDKGTALLTFKGAYSCSGQGKKAGAFAAMFNNRSGKWMNVFCGESSNAIQ